MFDGDRFEQKTQDLYNKQPVTPKEKYREDADYIPEDVDDRR